MKLEPEFAVAHGLSIRLIEIKNAIEAAAVAGTDTYALWIEAEAAFLDKMAADHRSLLAIIRRRDAA
jgi:hypothetical protein